MKVYIGYECHNNGCDIFHHVAKVFDDEIKAFLWREDMIGDDQEWREIQEWETE